jgi:endo-1,4-beta-xylanase
MSRITPYANRVGQIPAIPLAVVLFTAALASCAAPTEAATSTLEPTARPATKAPTNTGLPTPTAPLEVPSVYQAFADDFLIGAAIEPDQLNSKSHAALLTRHFNSITAENVMKPGSISMGEGKYRFNGGDKLVQFAREHNLAVHGHTLVWHQQAAEWMWADADGKPLLSTPENKQLALDRLETYIRDVAGHFKDGVNVWDVVNEVIDPAQADCLRRTRWYELTGAEYIALAFRAAREAAPDAQLIINDYSTTDPAKRECLYKVVKGLLAQGVPVDGVGHQMHIDIENPSGLAIEQTLQRFAELGVTQHITELDMSIYANDTDKYTTVPEEVLVKQGYRYKEVFDIFRRQAANIDSVTFWGMADDHTWLLIFPIARINLPLLFDDHLQPKPAYWGIMDPSKLPVQTQHLTASEGTPVVDGEAESLWNMQSWPQLPAGGTVAASFQTLWDKEALYVFVDVKDATRDPADRIDLFIDQNNGKTAAYEDDDLHIICRNGACTPSDNIEFSLKETGDGYRLEAAVKLAKAPAIGREIGFDLRVTDSAAQNAPISWNDSTNGQDTGTANYGTIAFAEAVALTVAVQGTPVIDGVEDAVWATANEISTGVWVVGSSGSTAKVKTLWNGQYLYVYAVVTDKKLSKASANTWEQDSIEVFLDQDNAKTSAYEADDAQYRVNFDNEQSFNGGAKAELIRSVTRIVPGGYVVELAIKLDAVAPAAGVRIGFDFQVNNDEDGDGVRDSVAIWHDPTGQSYQNTSKIGVLEFG